MDKPTLPSFPTHKPTKDSPKATTPLKKSIHTVNQIKKEQYKKIRTLANNSYLNPLIPSIKQDQFNKKRNLTGIKGYQPKPLEVKIHISHIDSLKFPDPKDPIKGFLEVEQSTNNSSFQSKGSSSVHNTPSPKPIQETGKGKNSARDTALPARFLTAQEREEIINKKYKRPLEIPPRSLDLTAKVAEQDLKNLENELLYRKYRKNKIMKKLIKNLDDSWEWSSHGSSPGQKVHFLDVL